jgi:ribosomal protein L40E
VPIPVTCRCGQSFAAGDHLAGRTVQCPKCKSPLAIPAPHAASTPAAAPAPQSFAAGPSIFDDAGMRTFTGKPLCPECQAEMQPGAILCVKCGYNVQLGRKMTSYAKGAAVTQGGHADAAADLLRKAARQLEEDKLEEKKKFREGMPWWMLGGIFLFALTTCIMLLVLPARQAINTAMGVTLAGAGISTLYNLILLVIIGFKDRPLHGVLLMIHPGFAPLYILSRWEHTNHIFWGIIRIWIGAGLILLFLFIALLIAIASKPAAQLGPPHDAPEVVVRYQVPENFYL